MAPETSTTPGRDRPDVASASSNDGDKRASGFAPRRSKPWLQRVVPVSAELAGYGPPSARRDLLAGVTVAALALPAAMAYAELAGIDPVHGLYALLLPAVAYVVFGSSKRLVIGPEGSISAMVAAAILPLVGAGSSAGAALAAMLALLVGGCFVLARVVRLGWLADYFSRPVLIGYIAGVAVVLIISQLGKLLGLSIGARDPLPQLVEVIRVLGDVSLTDAAVGVVALLVLLPLRVLAPRFPTALVVVIGAIVVSSALNLQAHGVLVIGQIPGGLPSFQLPSASLGHTLTLLPAALGIFAVGFVDELLTARSFAGRHGEHVRAEQELLAMGVVEIAAGITQGYPVGASGSRTAVNDSMGVRTQFAGLFSVATIVAVLLFLTGPIAHLPRAVLGAVIVNAAVGLLDLKAWRTLATSDPVDLAIAAVTASGVIAIGVLESLFLAVGLSVIDVVRRSARPHDAVLGWVPRLGRYADVQVHRSARLAPGVVIYRLDDRLFFANASYVRGRIGEAVRGAPHPVRWVVLDAEALTHIDTTGAHALRQVIDSLRNDNIGFAVARLKEPTVQRFGNLRLTDRIGAKQFYPTVRAAVTACVAADESIDVPAAHP